MGRRLMLFLSSEVQGRGFRGLSRWRKEPGLAGLDMRKVGGILAAAGLSRGDAREILLARLRRSFQVVIASGRRAASTGRMALLVVEKQLVTQLS